MVSGVGDMTIQGANLAEDLMLLPFLTSRGPLLEMKGRVYATCVKSSMTYGSETRPLLVDVGLMFERAEIIIIIIFI